MTESAVPDLYSLKRVRRVGCFDGWSRIVRTRQGKEWRRVRGWVRLTPGNVRRLKQDDVAEVEIRRWFRRARVPVSVLHRHFH